ncbi:MAG: tRNA (adenosine(37)-N6)-dimethylallyltransferase MiaA [Chloroflexota bacterium]
MNNLIAIVGPTGVGKSQLALHLAHNLDGEIVSADSRQIYQYMDIGTAKIERQELSLVPHHLIDIIKPDELFSLAQYQQLASKAIDDIYRRQKLPLLVGGSGQYLWSVVEGWGIPKVPPDPELRRKLEEKAARGGGEELYRELLMRDPVAARRVDRHNIRRVIRALEVSKTNNQPRQHKPEKSTPYNTLIIGLMMDRNELYHRIDFRIDRMIERGLAEEVKKLMNMGYNLDLPSMSSIGYRQIGEFLKDKTTLEAAIQQIKFESHRLVRQQYNWFSPKDDRIRWFDVQKRVEPEILALVDRFIKGD